MLEAHPGNLEFTSDWTRTHPKIQPRGLRTGFAHPTGRAQALTVANIEYADQSLAGIDEDGALEIGNSMPRLGSPEAAWPVG